MYKNLLITLLTVKAIQTGHWATPDCQFKTPNDGVMLGGICYTFCAPSSDQKYNRCNDVVGDPSDNKIRKACLAIKKKGSNQKNSQFDRICFYDDRVGKNKTTFDENIKSLMSLNDDNANKKYTGFCLEGYQGEGVDGKCASGGNWYKLDGTGVLKDNELILV